MELSGYSSEPMLSDFTLDEQEVLDIALRDFRLSLEECLLDPKLEDDEAVRHQIRIVNKLLGE